MIKRTRWSTTGCVALFGWLMASGLQAHHSLAGVYDMKAEKEITGTVEKVQFVNPHGSLTISVKGADGTATEWVFTLGSSTALAGRGVGKNRTERPPHRGRHYREVHPGEGRPSIGLPQVDHLRRRAHRCGLRRRPQRLKQND